MFIIMNKNLFTYIKVTIAIALISIVVLLSYNTLVIEKIENNNSYELVVVNSNSTWTYEIFFKDALIIKQEYIPAVRGNQRFKSKKDAKKIGELMIQKLKNRKTPSITIEELKMNYIVFKS